MIINYSNFKKKILSPGQQTFRLLLMCSVFLSIASANVLAQGNLLITPRRAVFEGKKRSIDLNLANIGSDTATYAISIVEMRMKEDGGFENITEPDPGQRFADKYIRFFPRSVTLGPNESQVIKIQLTRSKELEPGEYRSHIYFRSIPKPLPLGEKKPVVDSGTIAIRLTPIFGITIPVIIRVGEYSAKVTISDAEFKFVNDTVPHISLTFNRTGSMSVYGDLTVDHISATGVVTRVGTANGIAVYTPNTVRRFRFNLNKVPGVDYRSGLLRISYSAPSDTRPLKYAESEILLN